MKTTTYFKIIKNFQKSEKHTTEKSVSASLRSPIGSHFTFTASVPSPSPCIFTNCHSFPERLSSRKHDVPCALCFQQGLVYVTSVLPPQFSLCAVTPHLTRVSGTKRSTKSSLWTQVLSGLGSMAGTAPPCQSCPCPTQFQ